MNSLVPRSFVSRFFNDPSDLLFRDFFDSDGFFDSIFERKFNYPMDVKETDQGIEFHIAVVGLDKKDIKIEVRDGNILSVSYDKKATESNEKKDNYLYKGITNRSFNFAWKVNNKFDLTKLTAKLEKGLLKIIVPVLPERAPTLIEIED